MTTAKRTRVRPGIYLKPNGRFVVRYRDGERVRDRTFESLREAEQFKTERGTVAAERQRLLADPPPHVVAEVMRILDREARRRLLARLDREQGR
jgi:hypothetical protein